MPALTFFVHGPKISAEATFDSEPELDLRRKTPVQVGQRVAGGWRGWEQGPGRGGGRRAVASAGLAELSLCEETKESEAIVGMGFCFLSKGGKHPELCRLRCLQ